MSPTQGTSPSRVPTSRAYWELKAEQVMNRVFTPEPSIELEIIEARPHSPAAEAPANREPETAPSSKAGGQLIALAAGVGLVVLGLAGASAASWRFLVQQQQALQQERNLLLIERLRSLNSSEMSSHSDTRLDSPSIGSGSEGELPPPPADELWMRELAVLPEATAPDAKVLTVPPTQRLSNPTPSPQTASHSPAKLPSSPPQLVGVIQIPGQKSSAIFQFNGSSTTASPGERIGDSDWRLKSASGSSATLERAGILRTITIGEGL